MMRLGLLAKKVGMSRFYDSAGVNHPATILKVDDSIILDIKTNEKNGYSAVRLSLGKSKRKNNKPIKGFLKKQNIPAFLFSKEFRVDDTSEIEVGQKFDVELFEIGQTVNVSGLSIGKGNLGNIKRNQHTRGAMSHGSKSHRLQGSLGAGTTPARVLPGKKMPGRSGYEQRTIKGLEIIDIDKSQNLIVVKGSIPGKAGNLVSIKLS